MLRSATPAQRTGNKVAAQTRFEFPPLLDEIGLRVEQVLVLRRGRRETKVAL